MVLRASALIEMLIRSFGEEHLVPGDQEEIIAISSTSLKIATQVAALCLHQTSEYATYFYDK